jgi:hypothetical protein
MSLPNQKMGSFKMMMMMMITFLIHFLQDEFLFKESFFGCGFARPKNGFLEKKNPYCKSKFFFPSRSPFF